MYVLSVMIETTAIEVMVRMGHMQRATLVPIDPLRG
jgi:hypothetical protein